MASVVGKVVPKQLTPHVPKPKRIWDNFVTIGTVQKSDKIRYSIAIGIRDGVRYINIREFYFRVINEEWRPGRDGITIPLLMPIEKGTKLIKPLEPFIEMLQQASSIAFTLPIRDPENAIYYIKKETDKK